MYQFILLRIEFLTVPIMYSKSFFDATSVPLKKWPTDMNQIQFTPDWKYSFQSFRHSQPIVLFVSVVSLYCLKEMSTKNSSFVAEEVPDWEIGRNKEEEGTNSHTQKSTKAKKRYFDTHKQTDSPHKRREKKRGGIWHKQASPSHQDDAHCFLFPKKYFSPAFRRRKKECFLLSLFCFPPLLLASHQTCIFGVIFVAKNRRRRSYIMMGKIRKTRNNSGNALFSYKARYFWVAPTHWNFPPKKGSHNLCWLYTSLRAKRREQQTHYFPQIPRKEKGKKIGPHNHQPSDQPCNCAM